MTLTTADEVYEHVVKGLPEGEQRRLADKIFHQLAAPVGNALPRKWSEIKGVVAHPMCGEDAQEWVSRTRREGDQRREESLRRQP